MTRKRSGVPVDQICDVSQGSFEDVKRRLTRWTLDHQEELTPLPILRRPLFLDNRPGTNGVHSLRSPCWREDRTRNESLTRLECL
jgi:hypothetical protein